MQPTSAADAHDCAQCRAAIAAGVAPPQLRGLALHAAIVRVMTAPSRTRWRSL